MIDHTHDPAARSWVEGADAHADFPVQNLPFVVFAPAGGAPRIGTVIGDQVLDLSALPDLPGAAELAAPLLNPLFAAPSAMRVALRHALFARLTDRARADALRPHLHQSTAVALHLPFRVGDYTDFYVGIHHATAIGRLFRPDTPLLPNYRHVPIGYHGRASSVRVSDTPVTRPMGLVLPAGADTPVFAPTARLDFELELGFWLSGDNPLGSRVPIAQAWDRIGGVCLLNDWSARDIQAFEYQPLGPFLGKSFLTTVSPIVVTTQALAPFRVALPARPATDPAPAPHLLDTGEGGLAITLGVSLQTATMRAQGLPPFALSRSAASEAMYWSAAQIVTHHASNGCDLHAGDLIGTGTLSGPGPGEEGSLMERTQGGRVPLPLPSGETRCFLEDGDTLTLTARAEREDWRSIGFGPCIGTVEPAR